MHRSAARKFQACRDQAEPAEARDALKHDVKLLPRLLLDLGVPEAQLEGALQEVLFIAHLDNRVHADGAHAVARLSAIAARVALDFRSASGTCSPKRSREAQARPCLRLTRKEFIA